MNYVFAVINPDLSDRLNALCETLELPLCIHMYGRGTAQKSVLELLGLRSHDYHVLMTVADKTRTKTFMEEARRQLYIDAPGHGIIVASPINSIGGRKTLSYLKKDQKDDTKPKIIYKHEIILAIANEGYTDNVMDAARAAGARGGTVLHGKGTGSKDAEKFFNVSIASEKEVVMIVAKAEEKEAIMKSIVTEAGIGTEAGAVCLSLPVSAIAGFGLLEQE